ncbi:MAG TPA: DoxX family protein [Gemmatimonadaceae bacterium]|jgi:hypothetical protein
MASAVHTISTTTPPTPLASRSADDAHVSRNHTMPIDQSSTAATWGGRILTGISIAFLLFDAITKLAQVKAVTDTMPQLGWSASLAAPLGAVLLVCVISYAIPQTAVLGAIFLTGYLGGAVATHVRVGNPLFTHILFPTYLGAMIWGGLHLRDARVRALIPFRSTNA